MTTITDHNDWIAIGDHMIPRCDVARSVHIGGKIVIRLKDGGKVEVVADAADYAKFKTWLARKRNKPGPKPGRGKKERTKVKT